MKKNFWLVLSAVCVLFVAKPLMADTLVTVGGRSFEGRVIEEDGMKVVFEIHQYGATMLKTFRRQEVKRIIKRPLRPDIVAPHHKGESNKDERTIEKEPDPPPIIKYDKPTYYMIPLEEVIGMHVTASYLERCLADAVKRNPSVIVLQMDSPGGFISEVDKLVDMIHLRGKKTRVVVYVQSAISAAAITSLACDEIYFAPQAIFGAATAYQEDAFGLPEAIAEKFQSVWRARARSAAALGGHNPLLAEAMIDKSMELYIVKHEGGQISIKAGKPTKGERVITTNDKLLTMTAGEAIEAGLSSGTVGNLDELGKKLGFEGWVECKGHATALAKHRKDALADCIRQMQVHKDDFSRNMRMAWQNRPEDPNIPYRYDESSGLYLPESIRRWRSRSRECATWLLKAESSMKRWAELTETFSELKDNADYLRRLQREVTNLRMEVRRRMNKRGPDD